MAFSFLPLPLSHHKEILVDVSPFILIHKSGRVERLVGEEVTPPSDDHSTGVQSKDVEISSEIGLSVRIYLPEKIIPKKQKLPILIYFHGGGFVTGTASSSMFQPFHFKLASQANIIIVSVDYRLAPEHPYPASFDDSWAALKWVASHAKGDGNETWLNEYADFKRVFCGGESAGATLAHHIGIRLGLEKGLVNSSDQVNLAGIVLIHPYFMGETLIGGEVNANMKERNVLEKLWKVTNPLTSGLDDPLINPCMDPNLSKLECKNVLIFVAENDWLRDRGWYYHEVLGKSGWSGQVDVVEAKGEGHAFHLFTPFCENTRTLLKRLSLFVNETN